MYSVYFTICASLTFAITPTFANGDEAADAVVRCTDGGLTSALADFTGHPGDNERFTALFLKVNARLAAAIESRNRLGGDTAEEIASKILMKIWNREIVWEGDASWTDGHTFNWLLRIASYEVLTVRGKAKGKSVATVNMSDETPEGEKTDFLGQAESSGLSGKTLSQFDIDKLPDAVERFVLMRLNQGKTAVQIGEELGRHEHTVRDIAAEARASLEEILKGRPPIVSSDTRRSDVIGRRVQEILEEELAPRPIRMPDDALKLTEEEFMGLLTRFSDQNQAVAHAYFVEGKRLGHVQAELGLTKHVVAHALLSVAERVGKHLGEASTPRVARIWIVDEHGMPLAERRHQDFSHPPIDPVQVEGAKFWAAVKNMSLKRQDIAKMRFIDRLSSAYIGFLVGMESGAVTGVILDAVRRVEAETGLTISANSLEIVGDRSMIHTSAVEIPGRVYLETLESKGNPSEATKLAVARAISGLPVENLPRIVLVDEIYQPLRWAEKQESFMPLPEEPEIVISGVALNLIRPRVADQDWRILNLYLRHRWSVSTLQFYFRLEGPEVRKALERANTALEAEVKANVQLAEALVVEGLETRTIRVDGETFRQRFRKSPSTTLRSVKPIVRDLTGEELTPDRHLELLGADGRLVFSRSEEFRAAPSPGKPTYMLRTDFENALSQTLLSDLEKKIVTMRFRDGWGAAGINYLLDLPPNVARRAIEKGVISLNRRTHEEIYAPNFKVVSQCSPDIHLKTWGIPMKEIADRALAGQDFRPEVIRRIAAGLSGVPEIKLEEIVPLNEQGRPPLNSAEPFYRPVPKDAQVIAHAQLLAVQKSDEQRFVAILRFGYRWSREFIGRITGKDDRETRNAIARVVENLKRNLDPTLEGGRLVIQD